MNAPVIPPGREASNHGETYGKTPLQQALLTGGSRALHMVNALIDLGADPKARDGAGRSTLCYCMRVEDFRLLESHGLDPLDRLTDGGTLLHNLLRMTNVPATHPEGVALLDYLLELGLDINATDGAGQTVLHVAAIRIENPADVQLLLDRGADRTIRDAQGRRPQDLVRQSLKDVRALL